MKNTKNYENLLRTQQERDDKRLHRNDRKKSILRAVKLYIGILIIIIAIYLRGTTLYFAISHFNKLYEITLQLQNTEVQYGEIGLNNKFNKILKK